MRKLLFCSAVPALALAASGASGAIVYDNTGFANALFTTGVPSIYFDDATAAATAPFAINQVDLGYDNTTGSSTTFDLLVQFYNTVNYGAASGVPVGTNPIGSLIDIKNITVAANTIGETGMISLVGPSLPISTTGTVGYEFEYVKPGTTAFSESNINSALQPIFRDGPPVVGSSSDDYAYDYLGQSTIVGDAATGDVFAYSNPSANVYAAFGATAVPEPGSLSLIAASAITLIGRRKRLTPKPAI